MATKSGSNFRLPIQFPEFTFFEIHQSFFLSLPFFQCFNLSHSFSFLLLEYCLYLFSLSGFLKLQFQFILFSPFSLLLVTFFTLSVNRPFYSLTLRLFSFSFFLFTFFLYISLHLWFHLFPFFLNHSQRQPPTQPLSDTSLRHLSKAASRYRINWISEKVSPEKTGFGFDFPKQICISWSKLLTSTIRNFSDVGELFRFCCFCIGRCRCRLSPVIKFLRSWALVETQVVEHQNTVPKDLVSKLHESWH